MFDEMSGNDGLCRAAYEGVRDWLAAAPPDLLEQRRQEAELLFRRTGITFAVYGERDAEERLIPFDLVPRILTGEEWAELARGLEQRVRAINMFLKDLYGPREIMRAGLLPDELIFANPYFQMEMCGLEVAGGVYTHIAGIDIVRVDPENFIVLEDNARTPSGVSYMLENREATLRLLPELFAMHRVAPIDTYPDDLLATLVSVAPPGLRGEPCLGQ